MDDDEQQPRPWPPRGSLIGRRATAVAASDRQGDVQRQGEAGVLGRLAAREQDELRWRRTPAGLAKSQAAARSAGADEGSVPPAGRHGGSEQGRPRSNITTGDRRSTAGDVPIHTSRAALATVDRDDATGRRTTRSCRRWTPAGRGATAASNGRYGLVATNTPPATARARTASTGHRRPPPRHRTGSTAPRRDAGQHHARRRPRPARPARSTRGPCGRTGPPPTRPPASAPFRPGAAWPRGRR